ncbi:MAG: magnesium transporter [Candidatus Saliniplasma sp.]
MDKIRVMKESLPFLFLCAVGGATAGFVLGQMEHIFELVPGLIVLVPAMIDMRGNISSTMGSRLGSAHHLGLLNRGIKSPVVRENIISTISLSAFIAAVLPLLYLITSIFLSYTVELSGLFAIYLISVLTGLTTGILLSFISYFAVILSIKYNLDPDNLSGPALTTIGDVITLLILFLYAYLIGGMLL